LNKASIGKMHPVLVFAKNNIIFTLSIALYILLSLTVKEDKKLETLW